MYNDEFSSIVLGIHPEAVLENFIIIFFQKLTQEARKRQGAVKWGLFISGH